MQLRKVQRLEEFLPPVIESNELWFYHIKRNDLYFTAVSKSKESEFTMIEMLAKLFALCKDFCGAVNEDSLRSNFILVQELLLDFINYGYVQLSSTSKLKSYIYTPPVLPKPGRDKLQAGLFGLENPELSGHAADKPLILPRISGGTNRNEIFLDVIEYLSVVINKEGTVLRSEVSGHLMMKCFIVGNPDIKIGLNEDLTTGSLSTTALYTSIRAAFKVKTWILKSLPKIGPCLYTLHLESLI